jgi:hypothetical protein
MQDAPDLTASSDQLREWHKMAVSNASRLGFSILDFGFWIGTSRLVISSAAADRKHMLDFRFWMHLSHFAVAGAAAPGWPDMPRLRSASL